ncbi:lipid-A-disaccharide synthase [Candidatus Pelagibacter sp.]|uniref:lipid-A-disaccharide synthase n=1 Tax=Candidatus Pelagibacter sp. TaxID=2024849 RepID=UPI003F85B0BE
MKKIFILTGETSGDKLASKVISKIKEKYNDIEYLSVGGSYLNSLGIRSIFNLKEITYIGFTSVILNFFKIKKKIDYTIDEITKFNPDILFSVDSPDFTLRVAERIKNINPKIKTIHYVAPQVWVWREGRVKKFKNFLDHILLLFNFEKKYFDKENINNTFVGHPLVEKQNFQKTDISNLIDTSKKIISVFPGSRLSELKLLLPILIKSIELLSNKFKNLQFIFHSTLEKKDFIKNFISKNNIENVDVISDDKIKDLILSKSIFAISKSGTVSLEICSHKIPSIIIYKMNFMNFMIVKFLVKIRFANIINIINDKEIIPELIQKECNPDEIYKSVTYLLKNPDMMKEQIKQCQKTLDEIKSKTSSADEAANVVLNYLT